MTAQIRRSCASVPANIAEGYGRDSTGAYTNHLRIAQGSLKEFETHLLLARRLDLISETKLAPLVEKSETLGKMLRGLIRSIEKSGVR